MSASVTGEPSWHQTALTGHAAVLVIDTDVQRRRYIQRILVASGCTITGVDELDSARTILAEKRHDVVVLSIDPREKDWPLTVDACRRATEMPLFVLAENVDSTPVAQVLEAGADDCLAMPLDESDLRIRILRLLRLGCQWRGMPLPRGPGELQFDLIRPCVRQGAREIRLTRLEYRTLWVLAQGKGAPLSFHDIETHVWGSDGKRHRLSLRRVVHRLRQKLAAGAPKTMLLVSEPRVGYRLCARGA